MTISNAQYNYDGSIRATIDGAEMTIPASGGNRHYAMLLQAEADGEITIEPYVGPTEEELLNQERSGMTMSRPEMVKAMGIVGILTTPEDRVSFAAGNIPTSLRSMLDSLPPEIMEEAEIILLTGTEYARLSPFWQAAINSGLITETELDDVYRAIESARE